MTSGGRFIRKRGVSSFGLFASHFAGDFVIFSDTREGMVTGKSYIFSLLHKFDLEMRVGSGTTASKTEAVHYSASTGPCEDGDTAPFTVPGPVGKDHSFVDFTKEFGVQVTGIDRGKMWYM